MEVCASILDPGPEPVLALVLDLRLAPVFFLIQLLLKAATVYPAE